MKSQRKALSSPTTGKEGEVAYALNLSSVPTYIAAPPTSDELASWKAAIQNKEEWSEAVHILQQYYATHGFGITSRNAALR